ncbi:hypothetical protein N2K95_00630 [Arthrobacter zhaoxinii]|uniref:Histidine kinase N-terminal 7TM region domain-containing protein n=1 Tax=Arthrobacter zhaoxinii TaxID=2964616 RepID=A0ABY5YQ88_9MICC|nr:hypothetical protein [Arthrobacter zhaoxinii]UWX97252.1 hypothetical protein N2K95_00630 [Arthrobacter zhaoxinii]
MSVTLAFQYAALIVSAIFALLRLPLALKGRNPMLFWALALTAIGVGLSIPAIYLPVDALLGGVNYANLILRYAVYGVVLLIGSISAAAFRSAQARRLIVGRSGLVVLAVAVIVTSVLFFISDLPVSSPGLYGYPDEYTIHVYAVVGRIYPAYVAACLIAPAFRAAAHARRPVLLRLGSGLIGIALTEVVIWSILGATRLPIGVWDYILPHSAVIVLVAGLGAVAFYGIASKQREKQSLLTSGYIR